MWPVVHVDVHDAPVQCPMACTVPLVNVAPRMQLESRALTVGGLRLATVRLHVSRPNDCRLDVPVLYDDLPERVCPVWHVGFRQAESRAPDVRALRLAAVQRSPRRPELRGRSHLAVQAHPALDLFIS